MGCLENETNESMSAYLLKNGIIVNEGKIFSSDIFINKDKIEKIGPILDNIWGAKEIDLRGKLILPGCIVDQVHFSEPGLTHKATIASES